MTGIIRLIIMTVIGYVIYAVIRRFIQPLMGGGPAKKPPPKERRYSRTDGAVDAEFEEID